MNILVVDDEKEIADLIEIVLKNASYHVDKYYESEEVLKNIENLSIDLAILDVMMPEVDGFTLCKKLREKYNFPIIFVTAKVEDLDKVNGLMIGGDDYITKPPIEFEILWHLCLNRGNVVQTEDLFKAVWKEKYYEVDNNTIMVHIRHLREKMKDTGRNPKYIQTIWGVGYKIEK